MDETTDQIESHIRDTREDLSANLKELEQKVKTAADWRHHYAKSPGTFLATALGGGLLLALATNRPRVRGYAPAQPQAPSSPSRPKEPGGFNESLSVIKGALIGLAANEAKSVLSQLLPGFKAQLHAHEKTKSGTPSDGRNGSRSNLDSSGGTGVG